MKNFTQIIWIFLFVFANVYSQQEKGIIGENNWLRNWTEFDPSQQEYGEPTQILTGKITEDTTLYKRDVYLLLGNVFVTNNATLTIEPGTIIIGDFDSKATLTITKGASIIANGLETDPIVFTSKRSVKRAGDWGGLVILGDAPTSKFGNGSVAKLYHNLDPTYYADTNYGGDSISDSSGVLKFVRIEYAGKRIKNSGYFNSLLLASIGNQTVLENVMISNSAGDSFKIWGGNLNLKKLVSYKSSGNDFKFNYGAQSQIENSIAIRTPYTSSSDGARCMQILAYNNEEEVDFSKKGTLIVAKNLTLINTSNDLTSHIKQGLIDEAVYVGANASLDMNKSVISGFNPAVIFEDKIRVNQESLEKIKFTDMYFNNCNGNIFVENNKNNEDLENWYGNAAFFNVYSKGSNTETFIDTDNSRRPDYRLRINKIIASNEVDPDIKVD
ncbi:hypothetical protein MBM09_09015 [Flaviramulus sp. BrNp1-15]|uniref:hypothetical protein n=1 Tax=Flaviramulus sp. BrNp1-15 TaxID=2916754 RepID=UPI001EE8F1F0|nr:hypothetical protein [Flaviramulus sp. BrNp1-15]ULC58060.1 hypothetical protein MBM09_09015 [Flaviramulus sp. BrNp1-15]